MVIVSFNANFTRKICNEIIDMTERAVRPGPVIYVEDRVENILIDFQGNGVYVWEGLVVQHYIPGLVLYKKNETLPHFPKSVLSPRIIQNMPGLVINRVFSEGIPLLEFIDKVHTFNFVDLKTFLEKMIRTIDQYAQEIRELNAQEIDINKEIVDGVTLKTVYGTPLHSGSQCQFDIQYVSIENKQTVTTIVDLNMPGFLQYIDPQVIPYAIHKIAVSGCG